MEDGPSEIEGPAVDPEEEIGDDAEELIDAEVVEILDSENIPAVDSDDDDDMELVGAEHGLGAEDGAAPASDGAPAADAVHDESVIQFRQHADAVYCIAVHPSDPKLVATGSGEDKACLWDPTTGELRKELLGHRDTVAAIAFSADGLYVATGGLDGVVAVWTAADGQLACSLEGPSEAVTWIAWHQRGHVILAGSEDTTCWMWKAPEGECMQIFAAHAASVTCGAFSGDGRLVVTGSDDRTLRVWNPRSGQVLQCIQAGQPAGLEDADDSVSALDVHPTNAVALFGVVDGRVLLAHLERGVILASWHEHQSCVEGVAFCPPALGLPLAASAGLDGSLCIWDTNSLTLRHRCAHAAGMSCLRWHPIMPTVLTGCLDGVLRVWDARGGALLRECTGHAKGLLDVAVVVVSPVVHLLVSTSDDASARVFHSAGWSTAAT